MFVADVFATLAALQYARLFTGVFKEESGALGTLLMGAHDYVVLGVFNAW